MLLSILQHHSVVRMGHKINARQPADLFQLHWPLIPLCSVCKLCWFCPISQDDFESYFHPLTCLQPHLSQHNTTLPLSPPIYLAWNRSQSSHKTSRICILQSNNLCLCSFYSEPFKKKDKQRHTVMCLIKKNKTKTNHIFTVRTGKKTQNSKTSDPLSHRDMHLWHVWKVCVLWKQSLPV